ncbi:hypothetical protein ACHAWF_010973 [Thalassiosira exigua]
MISLWKAVKYIALFLQTGVTVVQSKEVNGVASPGNFIIKEESSSAINTHQIFVVNSNVPTTIQQYNDRRFMHGQQPFQSNEAKVLITSDCASTTFVPQVIIGPGSIQIDVQRGMGFDTMPFMESSSYHAVWDYRGRGCSRYNPPAPVPGKGTKQLRGSDTFLSSLHPNSLSAALQTTEEPKAGEAVETERVLSSNMCNVNAEVMLDGCDHAITVVAPKIRAMKATLENVTSSRNETNPCVTDYEADIFFYAPPYMVGSQSMNVPRETDCSRAVPGRPYVDSTGITLQALPLITPALAEGNEMTLPDAAAQEESSLPDNNCTTGQNQLMLGEEWTKNAIGEHASVASFAAFSIALMTNHAPSHLVEDALKAGLDEVRHARTSFDIASKLLGKEVRPGPLPASEHEFDHDMKALALAVAKEGCIDETLSELEAAAEVDLISGLLDTGADGTKYDGVDRGILAWIRDELSTIASEEADHAALAWRTVDWICSVDADACGAVQQSVLNEDEMKGALLRRFGQSTGNFGLLENSWKKIYSHAGLDATCIKKNTEGVSGGDSGSLIMATAEKVTNALCKVM